MSGGPARGWWMVEEATARSLLFPEDGRTKLFGPKAEALLKDETGLTLEELERMPSVQFRQALKAPALSALLAGAKYATAMYKDRR